MVTELFIDEKGFFIQSVLRLFCNSSKLFSIIIVKTTDIVHYSGCVRADSSQDQKILKALVVCEIRVMEHNSFEQLNQLIGKFGIYKC